MFGALGPVVYWLLVALFVVLLFVVFGWLIPAVFGHFGVNIPENAANALAGLVALGFLILAWRSRGAPVV